MYTNLKTINQSLFAIMICGTSTLFYGCNEVTDNPELKAANDSASENRNTTSDSAKNSQNSSSTMAAGTDFLFGKELIDGAGNKVIGSIPLGSSVSAQSSALSVVLPLGYYGGTQFATASDANLLSQNIISGVSIFGVTGSSASSTASACTAENQTTCLTNSTYPTQSTTASAASTSDVASIKEFYAGGALQTGTMNDYSSTWNLTTAFQGSGLYSGVTSGITLSKVCSTQNVLGSAGTAVCLSGTSSSPAGAGDIASGTDCWNSSGSKLTGTLTSRGTLDLVASYPGAGCYSGTTSNAPSASTVCTGTTILGTAGTATCTGGSFADYANSDQHRDKATATITLTAETTTNAGALYTNNDPGFRAIPLISKDDDGYSSSSVTPVDRTGWDSCTAPGAVSGGSSACICGGAAYTTIAARIANCAAHAVMSAQATWTGGTKGNAGQGDWKLVTRTASLSSSKGREVWQDQRTGLLWSSLVSTSLNWCRASGSNNITNNPSKEDDPNDYCDNSTYQNTGATGQAISACYEDDGTYFKQLNTNAAGGYDTDYVSGAIDSLGKGGLSLTSTPVVGWRLPTINDYEQANVNGIRFVLPDMGSSGGTETSASIVSSLRMVAWIFKGDTGRVDSNTRMYTTRVRCVGR